MYEVLIYDGKNSSIQYYVLDLNVFLQLLADLADCKYIDYTDQVITQQFNKYLTTNNEQN